MMTSNGGNGIPQRTLIGTYPTTAAARDDAEKRNPGWVVISTNLISDSQGAEMGATSNGHFEYEITLIPQASRMTPEVRITTYNFWLMCGYGKIPTREFRSLADALFETGNRPCDLFFFSAEKFAEILGIFVEFNQSLYEAFLWVYEYDKEYNRD